MFKIQTLLTVISLLPNLIAIFNGNESPEQSEDFVLSVNPYGNEQTSFDTINWFQNENQFSLFLPSDIDRSSLKVYFDGAETIDINGTTLHSGDTTDVFANDSSYSVVAGSNSHNLKVFESANVSSMFLETKKPLSYLHENKSNKCSAKIRTFENGVMTLDSELKQIKGRGNSTWARPKKPYNIKFDKKTSLLGMDKAKKWSMLAAYFDPVFNKDPIGFEIAKYFDQEFVSDYRFVDLYINNEYQGAYIICEPVEIGENRINITDLEKATEKANDDADLETFPIEHGEPFNTVSEAQWVNIPNDPSNITGGYLIEAEFQGRVSNEVSYFATSQKQYYTLKEPEYASKKQVEYISNYVQEMEDAIISPNGYNKHGKHYTNYIDIDSFVNMYILLELAENVDGGLTSTFFYKDVGGKLVAGPLWDNDSGFGNIGMAQGITTTDPSKWMLNQNHYYSREDDVIPEFPSIYNRLFRIRDFRDKVSKRWSEIRKTFNETVIDNTINSIAAINKKSVMMNAIRWYDVSSEDSINLLIDLPREFLKKRIEYFDIGFSKHAAYLFYDVNGGRGYVTENNIMIDGQFAIVNGPYNTYLAKIKDFELGDDIYEKIVTPVKPPKDDMVFVGWNTRKDGKGKMYRPGQPIFMYGTTTLYAQWKVATGDEKDYNEPGLLDNPIIEFLGSVLNALKLVLNN